MNKENNDTLIDGITGYGMGFDANGDMILVKDGITYKFLKLSTPNGIVF